MPKKVDARDRREKTKMSVEECRAMIEPLFWLTICDGFDDLRLRVLKAITAASGGDAAAERADEELCRRGRGKSTEVIAFNRFMNLPPEARATLRLEFKKAAQIATRRFVRQRGATLQPADDFETKREPATDGLPGPRNWPQ